jgi:hypothetical protein
MISLSVDGSEVGPSPGTWRPRIRCRHWLLGSGRCGAHLLWTSPQPHHQHVTHCLCCRCFRSRRCDGVHEPTKSSPRGRPVRGEGRVPTGDARRKTCPGATHLHGRSARIRRSDSKTRRSRLIDSTASLCWCGHWINTARSCKWDNCDRVGVRVAPPSLPDHRGLLTRKVR